jgi:pimeloyl-ACP methyl ester carboxylesterase
MQPQVEVGPARPMRRARVGTRRHAAMLLGVTALATLTVVAAPGPEAGGAEPVASSIKATALGEGPTLVFLHGVGGTRSSWMPVARNFVGRYRIVVADLPGHGESPMLDPFGIKRVAEEVEKLIAAQPTDSVVLIGHSFGGLTALQVAVDHPKSLRGLVVVDAAPSAPLNEDQRKTMLRYMDEQFDALLKMIYAGSSVDSVKAMRIHAQAALVPPAILRSYFREGLYTDLASRMKDVAVPVLLVTTDRLWPVQDSWEPVAQRFGFAGLARLQVKRFFNCGHAIMVDQPDSLRMAIAAFADSTLGKVAK